MNCKTYRTEIDEASGGVYLSAATEAHLRLCEACRTFLRERQTLRRLVGDLEKVAAPPDFDFRLRARLAASSQNRRTGWAGFAPGAVSIALAACFALTVATALRFKYPNLVNDIAVETPRDDARPAATTNRRVDAEQTASAQMAVEGVAGERSRGIADVEPADVADETDAEIRTANPPRRRAMPARENNLASYSRAADRRLESATYNVRPVAVSRLGALESESGRVGDEMSFAVPVQTPGESMKIVLRDERGASRVVSIDPVSFGAQEIVGRKTVATRASIQSSEGVW